MGFEIDFLPVGDGKDGGDCIAIRYGNLYGQREEQTIVIIDGGYKKNGEQLVSHIRTYHKSNGIEPTYIDLVILTHPDVDHASGLTEVFNNFKVNNLLMHKPWDYSQILHQTFVDGRITPNSLEARIRNNLAAACAVETLAKKQSNPECRIHEPFAGLSFDNHTLTVLSPTKEYFLSLVPQFEKTPEEKVDFQWLFKSGGIFPRNVDLVSETWESETLDELYSKETTAENLSSTILLFQFDNCKFLFTADAGSHSFFEAMKFAHNNNIDISKLNGVQVPHHGSKHNIGKRVLNALLGHPIQKNTTQKGFGVVSVAKDSDIKHPSRKVTNAFLRRGYPVFQTKGSTFCYSLNAPNRNWQKASYINFFDEVDD